jgi:hypothetical protein
MLSLSPDLQKESLKTFGQSKKRLQIVVLVIELGEKFKKITQRGPRLAVQRT